MFKVKVILIIATVLCILTAILLIWLEEQATCGVTICKLIETICVILGVLFTKEVTSIKIK